MESPPDMRDEANLPPLIHDLLAEGRAVVEAEKLEKERREELAAGARRALIKVNAATAADQLVQLEPKVARLMPWCEPVDRDESAVPPHDFFQMEFELRLPGFLPLRVWVRRNQSVIVGPPVRYEWQPWEASHFAVAYQHNSTPHPYPSLGIALAHAREQWLKEHQRDDVPF
jgi:hypothetical protein